MKILVVGLGVIGTTYAYLFEKAGHEVEHFIRESSDKKDIKMLDIDLLDGRTAKQGVMTSDVYDVKHCSQKEYDFIFVSVPSGKIGNVVKSLDDLHIKGTVILACGIWENKESLDALMSGRDYVLGYPVAGGHCTLTHLEACVFDHFMLEKEEKTAIPNYADLERLFLDCRIKLEKPYDMLEWIWLHMAINAAVVSVAGKYGDVSQPSASAEKLMNSSASLKQAVLAIREISAIIAARGVLLKHYRNELLAYRLPTFISVPLMKNMFAKNILTRKIMTLHGNIDDLLFVCQSVYDCGKANHVKAPLFYDSCQSVLSAAK
ncbi:ketopantoate reductase [Streptococcus equinus]|uniref:Ketopantoate reductase n=1 Tax=Streptococcus equinus TaxID=1335 RepID=A0A1H0MEX7_STREI|nr:2-dehydropantoate 2-reductase N-terminal domain-containing protein [Streptococcus equinus]SDO78988.1 ketopantoate reductase [Streptococcus equinus]